MAGNAVVDETAVDNEKHDDSEADLVFIRKRQTGGLEACDPAAPCIDDT